MSEKPLIVIADDDPDLRALVRVVLEDFGYAVREAIDGDDLLEQLREGPRPDAIVLDLMMPARTGWGVIAEMRRDDSIPDLPIVIVTAQPDEDFRSRARELGVAGYLSKPYGRRELLDAVREALHPTGWRA